MKKFFKYLIWIILVSGASFLFYITRGKPEISVDFDSKVDGAYTIVFEARYSDGSRMPLWKAREILRKKERCTIIPSLDNGIISRKQIGFDKPFFEALSHRPLS